MNRYARQTILPEVGLTGQARLAQARVLVVGAGGLGSAVLPLLAGAGIGQIGVIDPDTVAEHNLHRQTLYRMGDVGAFKATTAAQTLAALNPDCRVLPLVQRLDPEGARAMLPNYDVVVDAADSFLVTYFLSDLCRQMAKPLIVAQVLGRAGYVGGFCGGSPSYRAVFPDLPETVQSCAAGGVMGPVVALLGAVQAQMVLSLLLGHDPGPLGRVMRLDLADWHWSSFEFSGVSAGMEGAGPAILSPGDLGPDDQVVELRSAEECARLPVPQAKRMTMDQVLHLRPLPHQRLVFSCATGLRAWRAAQAVQSRLGQVAAILAPVT